MPIYYGFARDLLAWLKMAAKSDGSRFPFVECGHSKIYKMKKIWKSYHEEVVSYDGPSDVYVSLS